MISGNEYVIAPIWNGVEIVSAVSNAYYEFEITKLILLYVLHSVTSTWQKTNSGDN